MRGIHLEKPLYSLVFLSVRFSRVSFGRFDPHFWHFVQTSLSHFTSDAPPSPKAVVKPQALQSGLATQSPAPLWHHSPAVFTAAELTRSLHRRSLPSWGGCLCLRATSRVREGVFIGSHQAFKNKICGPTSSKQRRERRRRMFLRGGSSDCSVQRHPLGVYLPFAQCNTSKRWRASSTTPLLREQGGYSDQKVAIRLHVQVQ